MIRITELNIKKVAAAEFEPSIKEGGGRA